MKIVTFQSGLGNQVFFYLFYLYLKENCPDEKIYGYYNRKFLKRHNGLELHKVFDIELPKATCWSNTVAWFCRLLNRFGVKRARISDRNYSENGILYDGYWQDKKFFLDNVGKLKYKTFRLDETNQQIKTQMQNCNSVCIHIRRGDYLAPEHIKQYGGICTDEYYKKAIDIMQAKFKSPSFFVFSNDIEWVKEKMDIPNPVYVNNNTGENSYLDMYLMSHCKGAILANSSFSYWGAQLNHVAEKVVVYPSKWFNHKVVDIFPKEWIGI